MRDKPICVAPWVGLNITNVGKSPCCHSPIKVDDSIRGYFNSKELSDLKRQLLSRDIKNDTCIDCIYKNSNSNLYFFGYGNNEAITEAYENDISPAMVSVSNDYTCGMACAMCNVSSGRAKSIAKLGLENIIPTNSHVDIREPKSVYQYLENNIDNLRVVTLLGGDPTMNPEMSRILELLANRDIEVHYHTNGERVKLRDGSDLISKLSKLKKLYLQLSIDGDVDYCKTVRVGYKANNMDTLVERGLVELPNASINIEFCCTNLNAIRLKHHTDYIRAKYMARGIGFAMTMVTGNNLYSVGNLPPSIKVQVKKELGKYIDNGGWFEKTWFNVVLEHLNKTRPDREKWRLFVNDRKRHDAYYKTNTTKVAPTLNRYFMEG